MLMANFSRGRNEEGKRILTVVLRGELGSKATFNTFELKFASP
jgi:hypothetical protein